MLEYLDRVLRKDSNFYLTLENVRDMNLPFPYWIAGGCIFQQIWNDLSNRPPLYGISDIDLVYFDSGDISYDAEDKVIQLLKTGNATDLFLDVKNVARCHVWFKEVFKVERAPYTSLEEIMTEYPFVNQMLAVWLDGDGLQYYAPLGLEDTLNFKVRRGTAGIKGNYVDKFEIWRESWPELKYIKKE